MAKDIIVTITRAGNTVNAPDTDVAPGDSLAFTCLNDFCVFFKNGVDPHDTSNRVRCGEGGDTTKKLKIKNVTGRVHFTYGVAVLHPASFAILTRDPDIIVDDGGGGGPRASRRARGRKKSARQS